jgi:hypothetical protein
MSQYSNTPSSTVAGVIETVGRELARGTHPRARRYSDRPMDLRLDRSTVVIDDPQPITTRMRRLPG